MLGKKIFSIYFIMLMCLTSFAGIIPLGQAVPIDVITTYDIGLSPSSEFGDGDMVLVNVSVDNVTGDPGGEPYYIKAINQVTHEWIKIYVTDNNSMGPGVEKINLMMGDTGVLLNLIVPMQRTMGLALMFQFFMLLMVKL